MALAHAAVQNSKTTTAATTSLDVSPVLLMVTSRYWNQIVSTQGGASCTLATSPE